MTITHSKVSAKADSGDATLVNASDWNHDHVVSGTANTVAKFTGTALANSTITDDGTTVTVGGVLVEGQVKGTVQTTATSSGTLVNDFALGSTTTILRWNATSVAAQWTGMAGGTDGRIVYVQNVGTSSIQIYAGNGNSLAANRFVMDGGTGGVYLVAGQFATMIYNGTASLWQVVIGWMNNSPGPLIVTGTLTANDVRTGSGAVRWTSGAGSPAGVVTGSPGDLYTNTSGGANTTLWVKESGVGTTAGWVAK